jgi:hypothetical protein
MLKIVFITPKSFGHSENIFMLQKIWAVWDFFCPIISGRLWKRIFFGHCPPSWVLSHMKVNMLHRISLGQMSCTLKTNVMHSQNNCPTPLRQLFYTLKTMISGQIVIAPSHWTKNFLCIWCKYTCKIIIIYICWLIVRPHAKKVYPKTKLKFAFVYWLKVGIFWSILA